MFIKLPVAKTGLDEAIEEALKELKGHEAHTEDYAKIVDQLTKLSEIQDKKTSDRLSKDTLALVLGNLLGIAMIIKHEETAVLVSKALPFIGRTK